jgi:NADP-dependent aldehyde dehydrogenase
MSSVNPVFLLPEALKTRLDAVADGYVASLTLGVGQFCTNPGLVVALKGPEADAFSKAVSERLEKVPAGTMVHPSIKKGYSGALKERSGHPSVKVVYQSRAKGAHPESEAAPAWLCTRAADFLRHPEIGEEMFGPAAVLILCEDEAEMAALASSFAGQLTGTVHGTEGDLEKFRPLFANLEQKVGRLIVNGFPTGVEVCPSMHHGGPFPSTSFPHFTSVGTAAVYRFTRPACYQGFPDDLLPPELRAANPLGIWRLVDGEFEKQTGKVHMF